MIASFNFDTRKVEFKNWEILQTNKEDVLFEEKYFLKSDEPTLSLFLNPDDEVYLYTEDMFEERKSEIELLYEMIDF